MASWKFITFGHWWFHFENERHSDFGLILASNKQVLENKFLFTPSLGLNTWRNNTILCLMRIVTNVTELHVTTNLKFSNEGHFGTFEKFNNLNFIEPSLLGSFPVFDHFWKISNIIYRVVFTKIFRFNFAPKMQVENLKAQFFRVFWEKLNPMWLSYAYRGQPHGYDLAHHPVLTGLLDNDCHQIS